MNLSVRFDQYFGVDFGGVVLRSADQERVFSAVDDDPFAVADPAAVVFCRNAVLRLHQGVCALLFHFVGNVIFELFCGVGSFFFGVFECSHSFEPCFFYELHEFFEFCVGLSRKSDHQCSPEVYAGNFFADA